MSLSTRLQVRVPKVIFEAFDDEVVVIDLDTGTYYSLREIAADLWTLLARGCSAHDAVRALALRHPEDAAAIERDVPAFLEELRREGLIAESEGGHAEEAPNGGPRHFAARYGSPVLARYSDMQELLLLDPIHDVDETGWPSKTS